MKLPVLIFFVLCAAVVMAFEDLGPLKTARKKYPQIFKTGSVNIISIDNIPCYVFSGDAEQAFSGDFAESESELYEEATFSAKSNFYEYFSKKNKNAVISMTGCKVLYQYNNKKKYTVILYVHRENITIKPSTPAPPQLPAGQPNQSNAPQCKEKSGVATTRSLSPKNHSDLSAAPQSSQERRIKKFKNKIKNNPNDTISFISLADLYKKTGDFSEAINLYCSAIKKIEQDKFFDETEKIRIIYNVAYLSEKVNKDSMALKYYHYLLRHKCSADQKKKAVAAISRLRLKSLP